MKIKFKMVGRTLSFAWRLDKLLIMLIVGGSLIDAVRPYISVFFSAYVIDGLLDGVPVMRLLITGAACCLLYFLLDALRSHIGGIINTHIETCVLDFQMRHAGKTLDMDFELLESPAVNDLRTRIRNDHSWGAGFSSVFWNLPWLLNSLIGLFVSFGVLFPLFLTGGFMQSVYSPLIIVLAAAVAVFLGFVPTSRLEEKFLRLLDQLNSKELGKKYGYFGHFYWQGGLDYKKGKDTRVYGAEGLIRGYCELGKKADRDWMKKATRVSTAQGLLNSLASGLIWAGAYVFVTLRAIAGSVSIGMVIQYANALNNFTWGLTSLAQAFSQFAVTSKRQQSTLDYMNYPDVLHKGTLPVEKRRDNEYEIEFKDVSFKYPGSDNYALKNLNLKLNVGQKLAVVGMNGSGKTTMIKLLCRLYDPTGGVITLNGYDIKKYDYREYMSVFSVVFQDFKLFSFPLGQNVAAGSDYDEDRVLDSLRLAGLSDRYTALAKGLDTPLYSDYEEGGVEISGGEAQKIAIARALYKGSTFVVLDEPTAALDPIAEFDIYSRFNDMINGKTAIYISHRLSSCRFCDDIAVFHEGRLIQRGSHDSLLKDEQGKYHELWNAQAQYYNKE